MGRTSVRGWLYGVFVMQHRQNHPHNRLEASGNLPPGSGVNLGGSMKLHITAILFIGLVGLDPIAAYSQQAGGNDTIEFVCRDAGLGKFGVVAKKIRNSVKAAAATAGVGNVRVDITSVVDVERPTIQVSRAALNAGDIPVTFTASPLGIEFGDSAISVVSPNDQPCNVTRDFNIKITRRTGGSVSSATDIVRVMSPGTYKRKRPVPTPAG